MADLSVRLGGSTAEAVPSDIKRYVTTKIGKAAEDIFSRVPRIAVEAISDPKLSGPKVDQNDLDKLKSEFRSGVDQAS